MKASDFALDKFQAELEKNHFRAYSPHTQAIDFHKTNILLPHYPTRPKSIFKCTTVTLGGLIRLSKLAQEAFSQKQWSPSWYHYTMNERYFMLSSLFTENIMAFLAHCLMDPEVPLTTNLIAFLLDLGQKMSINQSGRAQVSMLIGAFTEKVKGITNNKFLIYKQFIKIQEKVCLKTFK